MADECTPVKSSSRTISETVHAPVLSGNHLEMADSRCPASVHQNLLTSSSLKKTFEIDDGATDLRDIETLSILNLSGVGDEDSSCNEYLCFALHSSTIKHTVLLQKYTKKKWHPVLCLLPIMWTVVLETSVNCLDTGVLVVLEIELRLQVSQFCTGNWSSIYILWIQHGNIVVIRCHDVDASSSWDLINKFDYMRQYFYIQW